MRFWTLQSLSWPDKTNRHPVRFYKPWPPKQINKTIAKTHGKNALKIGRGNAP
jgi:hypothetical protein